MQAVDGKQPITTRDAFSLLAPHRWYVNNAIPIRANVYTCSAFLDGSVTSRLIAQDREQYFKGVLQYTLLYSGHIMQRH